MIRYIIGILAIILLASILGFDACTCGAGPEVRKNLRDIFGDTMKGKK